MRTDTVHILAPAGIDAKGRNGYFHLHEIRIIGAPSGTVWIELYSRRQGDAAPVIIDGPAVAIMQLVEMLQEACTRLNPPTVLDNDPAADASPSALPAPQEAPQEPPPLG